VWLRFRLWSWFFDVSRELSKLLLLDALLVTSDVVETLSCEFAPRE